jgi:hypothetical protein
MMGYWKGLGEGVLARVREGHTLKQNKMTQPCMYSHFNRLALLRQTVRDECSTWT